MKKEKIELIKILKTPISPKKKLKTQKTSKFKKLLYSIIIPSNGIIFGFGIGIFNTFYEPFIEKIYKIKNESFQIKIQTNLSLFFLLGGFTAALTCFYIYEKIGRFNTLILSYFFNILICFFYLVENLGFLYFVRFLNGYFGAVLTFVCPLMSFEIVVLEFRRFSVNLFYFFLTLGILFSYGFGGELSVEYWKFVFLSPLILLLPSFLLVLFYFPIKSPLYIYQSNIKNPEKMQKKLFENYKIFHSPSKSKILTKNFITERISISKKTKKKKSKFQRPPKTTIHNPIPTLNIPKLPPTSNRHKRPPLLLLKNLQRPTNTKLLPTNIPPGPHKLPLLLTPPKNNKNKKKTTLHSRSIFQRSGTVNIHSRRQILNFSLCDLRQSFVYVFLWS